MFSYADPTGGNSLGNQDALLAYRIIIHRFYRDLARLPSSAFTLLEAFGELTGGIADTVTVPWIAFPKTANASADQIDRDRLTFQDEYVEWRTERAANGSVTRITFTTEFQEYYEALASAGLPALVAGIRQVISGANPTAAELFGAGFNPDAATPEGRASQFRARAEQNPWNSGQKGLLFLIQQFNTIGALFNLAGRCAVARPALPPGAMCSSFGQFCGDGRNSDPVICEAVQNLARDRKGLSLADPVGIHIRRLEGIWKINGQVADINNPAQNQNAWQISRNGRRGVLDVSKASRSATIPLRLARRSQRSCKSAQRSSSPLNLPCRNGQRRATSHLALSPDSKERQMGSFTRLALVLACVLAISTLGSTQPPTITLKKHVRDNAPVQDLTVAELQSLGDPFFNLVLRDRADAITVAAIEDLVQPDQAECAFSDQAKQGQ